MDDVEIIDLTEFWAGWAEVMYSQMRKDQLINWYKTFHLHKLRSFFMVSALKATRNAQIFNSCLTKGFTLPCSFEHSQSLSVVPDQEGQSMSAPSYPFYLGKRVLIWFYPSGLPGRPLYCTCLQQFTTVRASYPPPPQVHNKHSEWVPWAVLGVYRLLKGYVWLLGEPEAAIYFAEFDRWENSTFLAISYTTLWLGDMILVSCFGSKNSKVTRGC